MSAIESDALERSYSVVGTRPNRPDGVDKVTGRARYGADTFAPGMLTGRVLRSPHPHARIRSIDVSKALALTGVKAVVTRADFEDVSDDPAMLDTLSNLMAGDKALYEGHGVAAVAAVSPSIARRALELIEVGLRGPPSCHRCRGCDAGGRANFARQHVHRRDGTASRQSVERGGLLRGASGRCGERFR